LSKVLFIFIAFSLAVIASILMGIVIDLGVDVLTYKFCSGALIAGILILLTEWRSK